jgi:hypothetical protein
VLSRLATIARIAMAGSDLERAMSRLIARDRAMPSAILPKAAPASHAGTERWAD